MVPQLSGPTNNVADEAVFEEMDDSLERAATTATSLDAEQDRGNINKTQSKATLNEPSSLGTSSGSGPMRQETMRDTIAQTRFENVCKTSNDSLLAGVNIPLSDEDSLKLKELLIMEYLVNISKRHAFWSLNKVILKITILTTNTPYPSRKIRRICAKDHKGNKLNTPIPKSLSKIERGVKSDIEPIAPTMTVNRLIQELDEKIKLHLEREMEFNRWKSKKFKGKHPTLVIVEGRMDDEGEVT
ncbi:hypothetical protein Tco_0511458 [Tanacetum coccineum]